MKIIPEEMDWRQLEDTAKAIIRKAKADLVIWEPVLKQVKLQLKQTQENAKRRPKTS